MSAPTHLKTQSRRAFLAQVAGRAPLYTPPTITPNADFFTASIGPIPCIDRETWILTLGGLVEQPLTLDWDAVQRFPSIEVMQTIACIGGGHGGPAHRPLIGNAVWRGFPLMALLEEAGIAAAARRVRFWAADGYSTAVDLWWLQHEGAMLAHTMDGVPLPAAHGGPLRLLVPGLYGQKMPKWITRIELIDFAYAGYWESRGWSDTAAVKTRALFLSPQHRAQVEGVVSLQGAAYAGDRDITRVEVSVDGEAWQPAMLVEPPSPAAWTAWRLRWEPPAPGGYTFRVRATDARGFTQSKETGRGQRGGVFPGGSNVIDRLTLIAM